MPDLFSSEPEVVAVLDSAQNPVLLVEEPTEEGAERMKRELLQTPLEDDVLNAFNLSVFPVFFAGVQVNYLNSSEHIITVRIPYFALYSVKLQMYQQMPLLLERNFYRSPVPTVEDVLDPNTPNVSTQNHCPYNLNDLPCLVITA